jgi:hypothetical protein
MQIKKRGYNLNEAMFYLGVKRKAFDKYFRPYLNEKKFGTSIVFDVVDLDAVMDNHMSGNERLIQKGEVKWADNKVASTKMTKTDGALIKSTKELGFESALKSLKMQKTG